jgi:hypothetical protein
MSEIEEMDEAEVLHPARVEPEEIMSVSDIAANWLSTSRNSRFSHSEIVSRLFNVIRPHDGAAIAPFDVFDQHGQPLSEFDWNFDYFSDGEEKAAEDLHLSLEAVRRWSQTAEGKAWLRRCALSQRPAFLVRGVHARTTIAARGRCRDWLIGLMNKPKEKAKAEYFEEAQPMFGISERQFNEAWNAAIKSTGSDWGKAGRPKGSLKS